MLTRRQLLAGMGLGASALLGGGLITDIDFDNVFYDASKKHKDTEHLVPLFYSKGYNISAFGLEKLHPFDGSKYQKIYDAIKSSGLRSAEDFERSKALKASQLMEVHTSRYLESLKDAKVLSHILEVGALQVVPPILTDWRILKPMRLAAGGTLETCRAALKNGLAINIGGGYHHADRNEGGGFCVYCDGPIAMKLLRKEGLLKSALIVDTDAHQGNGFANVARGEDDIHVLDFFDQSIYPYPKVKEDWSVPLPAKTDGHTYLAKLKSILPEAIDKFKPDFIFYNAGSDVLASDPLSTLLLRVEDMNERDLFVVSSARAKNIPLAMVLAGGYGSESAHAHSQSILQILRKFDGIA
jgi:histone deacetylase 11